MRFTLDGQVMYRKISLTLLVATVFGVLVFTNNMFLPSAKATYVEGGITQDTIWTASESPFIVSNDITVLQNRTLTIEPGVEVRFGGGFSIFIQGKLTAIGTSDKNIVFTSNKKYPEAGDWNTLLFKNLETSTLMHCVAEYATSALTVDGGHLLLASDTIRYNSRDGVRILGGVVNVENTQIRENNGNGILVANSDQVVIRSNTIQSNFDGILLNDTSTNVDITQNSISSNTQSGIHLAAFAYSNTVILHNTISSNKWGLYVTGEASTYITNNSISYNTVGVLYAQAQDHEAHYNDIYGNEVGMDTWSNAVANAIYNYWGDKSGPYHISLNPDGEGNLVGGNGVNPDFLPFLTAPMDYQNRRPEATLITDKTLVRPDQTVTFLATNSSDDRVVDQYFFSYGDGQDSGWTTLPISIHQYSSLGTFNARLTVKDDFGVESVNTAIVTINVENLSPLIVDLTSSQYTFDPGDEALISVHVTDGTNPVEGASVTVYSASGEIFIPKYGLTNATGYFTEFFVAPDVTHVTNLRVTATASKGSYVDGSDYEYLIIKPPLLVDLISDPFKSEEAGNVTVHVSYSGKPVPDAFVTVTAGDGNFSETMRVTDQDGDAMFVFTAPRTLSQMNLTIHTVASKVGYVDGIAQMELTIEPKTLHVTLQAYPITLISEAESQVTVQVTHDSDPVPSVTVNMTSDNGGSFHQPSAITNAFGECYFTFTAPQPTTPVNITITAIGSKTGYITGWGEARLAVYLGTLDLQLIADPEIIESDTSSIITLHLTCNSTPVTGALVEISSNSGGVFSIESGFTDSEGTFISEFTAPQTQVDLNTTITVTATKDGYNSAQSQTQVYVNPSFTPEPVGEGFPILTILMIAIPIVAVVVILILIKLRVIVVSSPED